MARSEWMRNTCEILFLLSESSVSPLLLRFMYIIEWTDCRFQSLTCTETLQTTAWHKSKGSTGTLTTRTMKTKLYRQWYNTTTSDIFPSVFVEYNTVWTDGTDFGRENDWYWDSTGRSLVYKHWRPGHPNGKNYRNCMVFGRITGYMFATTDCDGFQASMCEKSLA